MKLVLDADAAAILPRLAGSPRKQGEYVSRLIRQAAAVPPNDADATDNVRREAFQVAAELTALANQLLELAGQPNRAVILRVGSDGSPSGS